MVSFNIYREKLWESEAWRMSARPWLQLCMKTLWWKGFCCDAFGVICLTFCTTQTHAGECADWPGGGSGGQDQQPTEFSGGASAQARIHRGDAAAGTQHVTFSIPNAWCVSGLKIRDTPVLHQETCRAFISKLFPHLMRCDRPLEGPSIFKIWLLCRSNLFS